MDSPIIFIPSLYTVLGKLCILKNVCAGKMLNYRIAAKHNILADSMQD